MSKLNNMQYKGLLPPSMKRRLLLSRMVVVNSILAIDSDSVRQLDSNTASTWQQQQTL